MSDLSVVFDGFNTKSGGIITIIKFLDAEESKSPHRYVKASEIAKHLNASASHVEGIIRIMKQNKWVESMKGPGGGFCLARPASTIMVYDVLNATAVTQLNNNAFIRLSKNIAVNQF